MNEKVNTLAEVVKKVTDKDDAQQMFMQQLASVQDEIAGLRTSTGTRERFIKPRKIKPYDGESQTLQSFLTAIELQMKMMASPKTNKR